MKKSLITIFLFCISIPCFAAKFTKEVEASFYDSFQIEFFQSMEKGLIEQGFYKSNVKEYIEKAKAEFNLQQFKKETSGCLRNYEVEYVYTYSDTVFDKCFSKWIENFIETKTDVTYLLKYPKK